MDKDKELKELQDWFNSLTLEEFLEQTETCEDTISDSEWNDFIKKKYGKLPERPYLMEEKPEPPEDDLPW